MIMFSLRPGRLGLLVAASLAVAGCSVSNSSDGSLASPDPTLASAPSPTSVPLTTLPPTTGSPTTIDPAVPTTSSPQVAPTESLAEAEFVFTVAPLGGDPLERSSWNESCPVPLDRLSYLTVTHWDFSGAAATGELIVDSGVADDIVEVFRLLFEANYPISEMRVTTQDDIDHPDPLANNSGSFACRPVTGSTTFSQHAYGLAIDINPFYNPYIKGDVIVPAGASEYADRSLDDPAIIGPDSPVVAAFSQIGWSWGGNWSSLVDYQHFSQNNR